MMGLTRFYIGVLCLLGLWACGTDNKQTIHYIKQKSLKYKQIATYPLDSLLNKVLIANQYILNHHTFDKYLKEYKPKKANDWYALFSSDNVSDKMGKYTLQAAPNGLIKISWQGLDGAYEGILKYLDNNFVVFEPLYGASHQIGNVAIMLDLQRRMSFAFVKHAWKNTYNTNNISKVYLIDGVGMPTFELINSFEDKESKLKIIKYNYHLSDDLYYQPIFLQPQITHTHLSYFTYVELFQVFNLCKQGKYISGKSLKGGGKQVFNQRPLWTEH